MGLLTGLIILGLFSGFSVGEDCPTFKVVCYYGSWAMYRPDLGAFNVSMINPHLCTDLIYTFIGLDLDFHAASIDPQADTVSGGFSQFIALKEQNPCLKTTLAIGGWNDGSQKYSVMVNDDDLRKEFIDSVIKFLTYYGFDGLDVDWEYPTQRGGIKDDREKFVLLIKELKQRFQPWNLTVSVAISIADYLIDEAYDVAELSKYLDYVNLMAYDYVASNSLETGLNTPMSEIEKSLQRWLDLGLDRSQMILGLPAYVRYYYLNNTEDYGIGANVSGPGQPSAYTQEPGFLTYYEFMYHFTNDYVNETEDGTHYMHYDKEWITFDDEKSYALKVQYALDNNLGGVMLWSIDTDNYLDGFVILNYINDTINKQN